MQKGCFPFLRNYVLIFLTILKYFSVFSKYFPGFSNFFIFAKFLPGFLKIIPMFLCIPKFYKKIRNTELFQTFLKISSQMTINWSYIIMSAKCRHENWKFFQIFIKIFQQPHQLTSKCLSNLWSDLRNSGISGKNNFENIEKKRKLSFLKIFRNVNFKML